MSVNLRLTGFKNKQDETKQLNNYNAYLAKQIEVNKINADAMDDYYRNKKLDISPAPQKKRSAEDELADSILQRDILYKHLLSFLKEADAANVMFKLQADDEVVLFNRFADVFKRSIKGQKNISPAIFNDLWERYKQKLVATANTDIPIGSERGEYNAELKDIAASISDVETLISGISSVKSIASAVAAMRIEAVKLAGSDQKTLESSFEDTYEKAEGKKLTIGVKLEIPNKSASVVEEYEVKISTDVGTKGLWLLKKANVKSAKWDLNNNAKIQYILYKTYEIPLGQEIIWTGNPKTAILAPAKAGMFSKAVATAKAYRPGLGGTKSASIASTGTGVHKIAPKPYKFNIGCGLDVIDEEQHPLAIDKIDRRRESLKTMEPNFGKYVISLNSLKKGILQIRYPSGANLPGFSKKLISSSLRKMINDLLFEKHFDEEDYEELDEVEKKLFDDMITLCRADKKDAVMLYKHKKYSDKERDKDVKRFNILSGEIMAGNDSPDIIKELKYLLFKLMSEKCISRAEYNKIMERIMII